MATMSQRLLNRPSRKIELMDDRALKALKSWNSTKVVKIIVDAEAVIEMVPSLAVTVAPEKYR